MKQKQHHDESRVEVPVFKSNKVVLVHGVATWIKGRIYQVKGSCTYLVYCGNHKRFVHVDRQKKTPFFLFSDFRL